jgi:hypothetical protein
MKPIRCTSSRILAISGLLLGILLPLLRAPQATAQVTKANVGADQAADTSYLKEMPDPARVLADIHGSDSLDTAARQRAALEILSDVVESFARTEGSNLRLTPEELQLNRRYHGAANEIISATYQTLDPNDQQRSVANSPRVKWNGLHDQYRESEAFIRELLDRYLSPSNRDRYLQIRRLRIAQMAPYRAAQAAQAAQEARQVAASAAKAAQKARQVTARARYDNDRFINGLVFIAIALLAVPWVLVLRGESGPRSSGDSNEPVKLPDSLRRVKVYGKQYDASVQSGLIYDKEHWMETSVSTTTSGGGPNNSTPVSTSTHVSSIVNWRYWLRNSDGREFSLHFVGDQLPASKGQVISVVGAPGLTYIGYNHSTGYFATMGLRRLHRLRCGKLWLISMATWFVGWFVLMVLVGLGPTDWVAFPDWPAYVFLPFTIMVMIFSALYLAIYAAGVRRKRNRQFEKRYMPEFRKLLRESTPALLKCFSVSPSSP